jgi:hypothetical protein
MTSTGREILYRVGFHLATQWAIQQEKWERYCRDCGDPTVLGNGKFEAMKVYEPFGLNATLDAWRLVVNLRDGGQR